MKLSSALSVAYYCIWKCVGQTQAWSKIMTSCPEVCSGHHKTPNKRFCRRGGGGERGNADWMRRSSAENKTQRASPNIRERLTERCPSCDKVALSLKKHFLPLWCDRYFLWNVTEHTHTQHQLSFSLMAMSIEFGLKQLSVARWKEMRARGIGF